MPSKKYNISHKKCHLGVSLDARMDGVAKTATNVRFIGLKKQSDQLTLTIVWSRKDSIQPNLAQFTPLMKLVNTGIE